MSGDWKNIEWPGIGSAAGNLLSPAWCSNPDSFRGLTIESICTIKRTTENSAMKRI